MTKAERSAERARRLIVKNMSLTGEELQQIFLSDKIEKLKVLDATGPGIRVSIEDATKLLGRVIIPPQKNTQHHIEIYHEPSLSPPLDYTFL